MSKELWVMKYAPKSLNEMIVSDEKRQLLGKIVNELPTSLIHGHPGTGKGCFMDILLKETGCEYLKVNASMENSIDEVRQKIQKFATSFSVNNKVVYLNECLDENEEIRVPGGVLKLRDMDYNKEYDVFSVNLDDKTVEFDKAEKLYEKEDEIYEVELENSNIVRCNQEHEFFVKDNSGEIVRKKLKDLSEGDSIYTM